MRKSTKIVATIGPASADYSIIKKMIETGVNIARLNFSHGSYENHEKLIANIRRAEKETGKMIAIMQDIQGPKIRLGVLPDGGIPVREDEVIRVNFTAKKYKDGDIPLYLPAAAKSVKRGHRLLIDDGHCELKVEKVSKNIASCRVKESYILNTHKGVNFPDTSFNIPILSAKDKEDLKFGVKMGIDIVAISFVSTAADIRAARRYIIGLEKKLKKKPEIPVFIVSKIERNEAVKNLEEILQETDGAMVARGDLAMETTMSELPMIQKKIIERANVLTKPVIVATQMLDSMQVNRRPTRAEITDVANAVIDHADALMLSNETATGKYPVESVKTMAEIISAAEKSHYDDVSLFKELHPHKSISKAVAGLSGILATHVGAKAILVASATGRTGRLVSRVRAELPVYVGAESTRACRQLCLSWGINSFILPNKRNVEDLINAFLRYVKKIKLLNTGDRIVMITGEPVGVPGSTNLLEVREIK